MVHPANGGVLVEVWIRIINTMCCLPGEGAPTLDPGGSGIANNSIGAPVCYQYYRSKQ